MYAQWQQCEVYQVTKQQQQQQHNSLPITVSR